MKFPEEIRLVIERLEVSGYEAYLVGGALRDLLLSREAQDFDVATSARPEEMKRIFSEFRTIETGLKHGTLTVIVANRPIEITTFRVDGEYTDSRHPQSVCFTKCLREDLSRRDFTINAMAYNEKTGLVDLFGGKEDLKRRVIRAVGEPSVRFSEDALRILRAFRFSAKLGFEIEEQTFRAIGVGREGLLAISAERICSELAGILLGQNAFGALSLMQQSGVLSLVLPLARLDDSIEKLSLNFETRLAFLLLGIQREPLLECLHRLKLSNASVLAVATLVALADGDRIGSDEPTVRRLMAKTGALFEPLMELLGAKGLDVTAHLQAAARCRARGDCLGLTELALDGRDLLMLGKKGREIGESLDRLLEAVLDDPSLNEKEKLVDFLKQHRI